MKKSASGMDFKVLFWLFFIITVVVGETNQETGPADGEVPLDYEFDSDENDSTISEALSAEVSIDNASREKATLHEHGTEDSKKLSQENDEIEVDDPYSHNPNHCNRTILSCVNIDCCKKVCVYNNENDVCLNDCIDDCINYNKNKIKVDVELLEVKPTGSNAVIELAGDVVTMPNSVGERCCSIDLPQHCIKIIDYPYYKCDTEKRAVCGKLCEVNSVEITQILDDDVSNMLIQPLIPTPNLTQVKPEAAPELQAETKPYATTSEPITTTPTKPDLEEVVEPVSTTTPTTLLPAPGVIATPGVTQSSVLWNNYNPPMSPQTYIPNYVYPYYYQQDNNPYLGYNSYQYYNPYQTYNPYLYYIPYQTYNSYPIYNPYPVYNPYPLNYNPYMQYPNYQVYYYVVGNCPPLQWVKPTLPDVPMISPIIPPNTTPSPTTGVEFNVPAE